MIKFNPVSSANHNYMNKDKIAQEDKWAESASRITSAQRTRKNKILLSSYYKNSHELLIERDQQIFNASLPYLTILVYPELEGGNRSANTAFCLSNKVCLCKHSNHKDYDPDVKYWHKYLLQLYLNEIDFN